MNTDNLRRMANQIASNLEAQGADAAAQATCRHIRDFWTPAMQAAIIAAPQGLSPIAARAIGLLAERPVDPA